jgi:chromosomal replication initiation ATPase DnaA
VQLDGRYRFENFVEGSANRLAAAAARAVAEAPAAVYNPLVIYGPTGLGKTHLLVAIGAHALALQPDLHIDALTVDDFVHQWHAAVSVGQADAFRQRYLHTNLLLIDNIQFLAGRRETQLALLGLCQELQQHARQIVVTSDRPPAEISDIDERLVATLTSGLVVDIGAPDYETRMAMLGTWCGERDAQPEPGVIEAVAGYDFRNVRSLQSALNRVLAHQAANPDATPATVAEVRRLLGDRFTTNPPVAATAPAPAPTPARAVRPVAERAARPAVAPPPVPRPAASPPAPPVIAGAEFSTFLTDVASAVARHVEPWRSRLGEAIAYWSGEGYRVAALDRALQSDSDPGAERVVSEFEGAVDRLRSLADEITAVDPALGGSDVFRDPERLAEAEELVERGRAGATPPAGPSTPFTRAGFQIGSSNELAVRAADAVIAEPGGRYNPLFIHGPSGVGKTHLVHAIGNGIIEHGGRGAVVACVGAQELTDELIAALRDGNVERWRSRYRLAGALLIDDVQFLAGKDRTQEEFFNVFNDLYAEGKQIVLSSDQPPSAMVDLEERLRSRFAGGLVVEIQSPDRALREKLYARYLARAGVEPEAGLVTYLADRPASSVREIAGVVNRLVATADLDGVEVTLDLARRGLIDAERARRSAPVATVRRDAVDGFFLDNEKVIWDWPDASGRVMEELR